MQEENTPLFPPVHTGEGVADVTMSNCSGAQVQYLYSFVCVAHI